MSGNVKLTVDMIANASGVAKTLSKISNIVKSKPIKLKATMADINTGNAQKAVDEIQKKANSIDKIVIKSKTYIDGLGKKIQEPVALITTYTNKLGESITETKKLVDASKAMGRKATGGGTTAVIDVKKQTKEIEQAFDMKLKKMEEVDKTARDLSTKSEKLNSKDAGAIRKQADLVQQLANTYRDKLTRAKTGAAAQKVYKQWEIEAQKLKDLDVATKRGAVGIQSWTENIKRAFVQSVSYATSLGVLRVAQQALNKTIQFAIELNKELVKIQVLQAEGAQTPAEIKALANSFNDLAKELGATTLEVAEGSVEWLRQGKSIAETQELLRSSTMLGKLGDLSAAEATEKLTSTLNSFKMEADEAITIVDKLVAVDNVAATSTRELAVALRYSAAVASEAGVELDQLISYIAVVSSTTRLNAEQIGQAMKTMLTRMQDIKSGQIDSEGLGLNNVESALTRINVKLRDTATSFRPMGDVLEDIANKWGDLNDIEQANVAKAVAGVRQQNMFLILMTNMNKALELQEVAFNSNGLAMDRYGMYLENVEASQNRLTATMEGLMMSAEDFDKLIIDVLNSASAVLGFIDRLGGIPVVLEAIVFATLAWKATAIWDWISVSSKALWGYILKLAGVSTATTTATTATWNLVAAQTALEATNPIGWVVLAIGAMIMLASNIKTTAEQTTELTENLRELNKEFEDQKQIAGNITGLADEYRELEKVTDPTVIQQERFYEVASRLKKLMPELVVSMDIYGNMTLTNSGQLDVLTKSTYDLLAAKQALLKAEAEGSAETLGYNLSSAEYDAKNNPAYTGVDKAKMEVEYQEALAKARESFALMGTDARNIFLSALSRYSPELAKEFADFQTTVFKNSLEASYAERSAIIKKDNDRIQQERIDAAKEGTGELISVSDSELIGQLAPMKKSIEDFYKAISDPDNIDTGALRSLEIAYDIVEGKIVLATGAEQEFKDALYDEHVSWRLLDESQSAYEKGLWDIQDGTEKTTASIADLNNELDTLNDVMEEQAENGYISNETALNLITSYADLAQFLEKTADGYKLNIENAKTHIMTQIEEALALYDVKNALFVAANGQYEYAKSALVAAGATADEIVQIDILVGKLNSLGTALASGLGSGGSGGKSTAQLANEAQQQAYKDQIELEKKMAKARIDALNEQLDAYKKLIDERKDYLKSLKEEIEYKEDIEDRSKSISDLELAITKLSLDNSQEAKRKRMELEEDLAEEQADLAKAQRDREYDLQIEALDKQLEIYTEMIEGQIKAIEKFLEETVDALSLAIQALADALKNLTSGMGDWGYVPPPSTGEGGFEQNPRDASGTTKPAVGKPRESIFHEGGIVEGQDSSVTAGLKNNEVLAKLLLGEVVLNEGQMDNIMHNILPRIASYPVMEKITNNDMGNIEVSMPITVEGSLDKTVLPDIEKIAIKVVDKLNRNMRVKGLPRTVNQYR